MACYFLAESCHAYHPPSPKFSKCGSKVQDVGTWPTGVLLLVVCLGGGGRVNAGLLHCKYLAEWLWSSKARIGRREVTAKLRGLRLLLRCHLPITRWRPGETAFRRNAKWEKDKMLSNGIFSFRFSMCKCRYGITVVPERQPERQYYCNPQYYFPHLPWWLNTQGQGQDQRTARVGDKTSQNSHI